MSKSHQGPASFSSGSTLLSDLVREGPANRTSRHLAKIAPGKKLHGFEEETRVRYYGALIIARLRDPDGIVTFGSLARQASVFISSVHEVFKRNPGLADEWGVLGEIDGVHKRLRLAAARFRATNPKKPLTRKQLAGETQGVMSARTVTAYLDNHPALVAELGVVYTYTEYGTGVRSKKK